MWKFDKLYCDLSDIFEYNISKSASKVLQKSRESAMENTTTYNFSPHGGARDYHKFVERYQDPTVARTYKLPGPVAERLNAMARTRRVGVSDLVGYLLNDAMNRLESGELQLKTRPLNVQVIEYGLEYNNEIAHEP